VRHGARCLRGRCEGAAAECDGCAETDIFANALTPVRHSKAAPQFDVLTQGRVVTCAQVMRSMHDSQQQGGCGLCADPCVRRQHACADLRFRPQV
jgi:hypothetical protein